MWKRLTAPSVGAPSTTSCAESNTVARLSQLSASMGVVVWT